MRSEGACPMLSKIVAGAVALLAVAGAARAEIVGRSGRFGGLQVDYKVSLPPGYSPDRAYPLVLLFTGGGQGLQAAQNSIAQDWQAEADRRGYVVISPAAPGGALFFQGGDEAFPAFLDMIRHDYRIAGGIHIAGHSNGGLSAFHIAAKYPSYFSTVTGYPGLYEDVLGAPMGRLKPLCLYMHAGDQDVEWSTAMRQQMEAMRTEGYRIRFTLEKGQAHRLKAAEIGLSKRLFDEIESCK
jgi:poly(3-hydroxybutyrate) depolymerase